MGDFSAELFRYIINREIEKTVSELEFSVADKVNTLSIEILGEIIDVLRSCELSDFDIVEKIVCIMEKYEIDCGVCHDFG